MKKSIEITDRKIIGIASLICMTSCIAILSLFNMQTFVINHNNSTVVVKTMPSATSSQVLELANIDESLIQITETVVVENQTSMMVYDTFSVDIAVDGQTKSVVAIPTMTVGEILKSAQVTLGSEDILSQDIDSAIGDIKNLDIVRVTREKIENTEYLDFTTVKRSSTKLDFGETKVLTSGQKGEKLITTEIILHDGVEVSNQIISEEILKEPENSIIEYGTFNVNRGVTSRDGVLTTSSGEKLSYSKTIEVEANAYCLDSSPSTRTKSGTLARVGAIAVDPRVIPLGTKLYITSPDGKSWIYGKAVAEDTGSAIIGNKIDLFFDSMSECISFGRQSAIVYVLS